MSEETTAPQEGEAQVEEVGLSYQDISDSVRIIDVTTSRGAIQGDELVQVGTIRERLVAFLRHAQEQGEDVGTLPPSSYNTPAEEAPAEAAE